MKARPVSTSINSLSPSARKVCDEYIATQWSKLCKDHMAMLLYANALAINDLYSSKSRSVRRITNAIGEIIVGYSKTIDAKPNQVGYMEAMVSAMRKELEERGVSLPME